MSVPSPHTTLAEFYQDELDMLRAEGATFAGLHPQIAESLGVGGGRSPDPHIELLQQSFAFFSGRLRRHVEVDKARIPNALAETLHPHLGAPVPSMLVARVDGVAKPMSLPRGQGFSATATGNPDQHVDCRLSACYTTPLLPLRIERVDLTHADAAASASAGRKVNAVLKACIVRDPAGTAAKLGAQECLRLYIDTDQVPSAWSLYELLTLHLAGMVLTLPAAAGAADGAGTVVRLAPQRLRWLGDCTETEAALPAHHHAPPAYRLLQEYFAFPHKFRFFEIDGLDLRALRTGDGLAVAELQFLFDVPATPSSFPACALQLNCVPLVNLFRQPIEPVSVDHTQFEYRLLADLERHRQHEIYTVETLHAIRADGSLRTIAPYFAADEMNGDVRPDYFYLPRRESSEATAVAGGEYFVSFLDEKLDLTALADDVIGGTALCTNRRLAEGLRVGSALHFEGAGLPVQVRTISHPTPYHLPAQIGQRPWQLVSQLALNRLSLADGPQALGALQQVLALHTGPHRTAGLRQIAGITHLHCRQLMRFRQHCHGRGFLRATGIHLRLDRNAFPGASPVLFWRVLRQFFALYAAVNQLVECSFETQDGEGSDGAWPPLEGVQWIV
jgi:type VI secretion system protein ImpG